VRTPLPASCAAAWRVPPRALRLSNDEVHVWCAALDQIPSQINSFLRTLAADERARAERFHFPRDREHFIVARGTLRAILGFYLNRAPQCLSFRYSSHGKPALTLESGEDPIRFNISHSHGVALYAITCDREVGIDLEWVRSNLEVEQIAERFFSCQEIATLRALPAALRRYAFFLCWTRKEAYIKARGEGLSLPLDQFDVSLAPGEPAALLRTRPDSNEALRWSLKELIPVPPGYAAALAVEGGGWSLALWKWPESPSRLCRLSE
jgi:4'-phosphopantetheinyl transferase